ncbi:MAG: hypothetical protein KY397_07275 [Gemmatimonadetes bacterium]|nr:hypothetical protein [Gemmatimonadota bacterium]
MKPATVRINPVGYAFYAAQFLAAGHAARAAPEDAKLSSQVPYKFSPVPYYLYCRAIELILKAFLLVKSRSVDELKGHYKHNLVRLVEESRREGLEKIVDSLPATFDRDLQAANNYYGTRKKAFEYFNFEKWARGYKDLPPLDRLEAIAEQLVGTLKPYCFRES